MKALIDIIQVLLSLFSKKQRITKPAPEFYEELPQRAQTSQQRLLGVDNNGEEVYIDGDISEEDLKHAKEQFEIDKQQQLSKNIVCNGHNVAIDWEDTVLWTEPGALMCKSNQYKTVTGNRAQSIDKIVVHWDGCLSSKQCAKVLADRGLSAHFCIDNDGTIHQLMDTNHVGWHARGVNSKSIGIEISNAVYAKYAKRYKPARPVFKKSILHGKEFPLHLDFYKVQVDALKELIKSICSFYNVPLEFPNHNGKLIRGVIDYRKFEGVMCHYHVTENKTDPACLDLAKVVKEIKDEQE
jgi:hypothetical protein